MRPVGEAPAVPARATIIFSERPFVEWCGMAVEREPARGQPH